MYRICRILYRILYWIGMARICTVLYPAHPAQFSSICTALYLPSVDGSLDWHRLWTRALPACSCLRLPRSGWSVSGLPADI